MLLTGVSWAQRRPSEGKKNSCLCSVPASFRASPFYPPCLTWSDSSLRGGTTCCGATEGLDSPMVAPHLTHHLYHYGSSRLSQAGGGTEESGTLVNAQHTEPSESFTDLLRDYKKLQPAAMLVSLSMTSDLLLQFDDNCEIQPQCQTPFSSRKTTWVYYYYFFFFAPQPCSGVEQVAKTSSNSHICPHSHTIIHTCWLHIMLEFI